MESLRKMYENLGFHKVSTYIQSGNVIFIDTKLKNEELRKKNLYSNQTWIWYWGKCNYFDY